MPTLRLHDTMRRAKVPFEPIDPTNVRLYVCGPTVYDDAHVGNARPVVVFDVLFRLLRHLYGAAHVTYARNITDVDDKINERAARDFPDLPLNEAIAAVTRRTSERFHKDVAALGCLEPTHEPRATGHIEGMKALIATLIERGHAYVAHGAKGTEVLFDVRSYSAYGALSGRRLDDQQAGARVDVEAHKRDPADFVLWKASDASEPGWDATFDGHAVRGRPGWHIECSAMSKHHLGETFDIHGGGLDLVFPHHENEIAQSCCANATPRMANVWMHNGYLQVEGRKMSKSEGNFVTIADVLRTRKVGGREWPGPVVKLALLGTHYREPIDFSAARLEEADSILRRWRRRVDEGAGRPDRADPPAAVLDALCDDLNTPAAFAALHDDAVTADELARTLALLGLDARETVSVDVEAAIAERLALLAERDYAAADAIRDRLLAEGVQLKDGKDPATGERITTWEQVR